MEASTFRSRKETDRDRELNVGKPAGLALGAGSTAASMAGNAIAERHMSLS